MVNKLVVDLDAVFATAMQYMDDEDDLKYPVGFALEDLYWNEGIRELQQRMIAAYLEKKNGKST